MEHDDEDVKGSGKNLDAEASPLDQVDRDVLEEIESWWLGSEAELAADAVMEIMEETECSMEEAAHALAVEFGEREDMDEVVHILEEREEDLRDEEDEDEDEDDEDSGLDEED